MRTRIGAWLLLLGVFVLLPGLAGCQSRCCEEPPQQQPPPPPVPATHFDTWQQVASAVAQCPVGANWQSLGLDQYCQGAWAGYHEFCQNHVDDCCEHFHQSYDFLPMDVTGNLHDCPMRITNPVRWCTDINRESCCTDYPELAARVFPNPTIACAPPPEQGLWAPDTPTAVPLESQMQVPPQAAAPIVPPPGEKPEPPAGVLVLPKVVTVTPSPTPPPKAEVIPVPPPACLAPPGIFDPPDGKSFAAMNTVFRWKPGGELGPDQVYDVMVTTDGGKTSTSVGTTRDTNLPIDFLKWNFAGFTGNFSWTVRIRDASGKYVSCESKWFSMTLTEIKGGPGAAPIPNQPPPEKPCHDPPKCSW